MLQIKRLVKSQHFLLQDMTLCFIGTANKEKGNLKNDLELVKSVTDKHHDLLRPSARYYSVFKGNNLFRAIAYSLLV